MFVTASLRCAVLASVCAVLAASQLVAEPQASAALPGSAPASAPDPEVETGATLRLFNIGRSVRELPRLVPDQAPNEDRVVKSLSLRGKPLDRRGLPLGRHFVAEFSGELRIERPGTYGFLYSANSGGTFELDGERLIDRGDQSKKTRQRVEMALAEGAHPFVLRYYRSGGNAELNLRWRPPGAARYRSIPESALQTPTGFVRTVAPGKKHLLTAEGGNRPGNREPLRGVHPAYRVVDFRPGAFRPRVGSMAFHPNGDLYLGTFVPHHLSMPDDRSTASRIWRLRGVTGDSGGVEIEQLVSKLADPMGMVIVGGDLFISARSNLYRLRDTDADGRYDLEEPITSGFSWDNFHQYNPGLVHRREAGRDYLYGTTTVSIAKGGDSIATPANRGTAYRVQIPGPGATSPIEYLAGGLRTPDGLGLGPDREIFVTDNQGSWLPSNKLIHLREGRFFGHYNPETPHPEHAYVGAPSLFAERPPTPPAVHLPHGEIARSPTDVLLFAPEGPFADQLMVGELTMGGVRRVFLEKVAGEYQGAVFRFSQGFEAGVHRLARGPDGHVYLGMIGSLGNWSWRGTDSGLQRLERRADPPPVFEMKALRATPSGFEIEFTLPADPAGAAACCRVEQWHYTPTADYGGEKQDVERLAVAARRLSENGRRLAIDVPGLEAGKVVYIQANLQSASGLDAWSTEAWYTLNAIPR